VFQKPREPHHKEVHERICTYQIESLFCVSCEGGPCLAARNFWEFFGELFFPDAISFGIKATDKKQG
jgi:hypothetical protein